MDKSSVLRMGNAGRPASRSKASRAAIVLLAVLVAMLSGCATSPVANRTPNPATLGQVAVVALARQPEIAFEGFARGKWQGAGKGAVGTFASCIEGLIQGGHCGGDFCGAVLILGLGVCGVAGGVGGVVGAVKAPWAVEAQAAEAGFYAALAAGTIQASLRDRFVETALAKGARLVSVPPENLAAAVGLGDYRCLAAAGVDTVLECGLTKVGTQGEGVNGPLLFYMRAQVRLIRTSDNAEVFSAEEAFEGDRRTLSEWNANQAETLLDALQTGYEVLGSHIYDRVFLLYPFPDRKPHGAGMLTAAFGLAPINPPTRGQLTGTPIMGSFFEWKMVDNLRPTFRWEGFPRPADVEAAPGEMGRVKNVRYDLVVAREHNLVPGEIVYRREGLPDTVHTIAAPLRPNTRYFWTVRARFELDGRPRVTEWAVVNYRAFGQQTAPSQWSYRFRTP